MGSRIEGYGEALWKRAERNRLLGFFPIPASHPLAYPRSRTLYAALTPES